MRLFIFTAMLAACFMSTPAGAVKVSAQDHAMRVPASATEGRRAHVLVIDSRPYVLDGTSAESFEGMTRELYGIPISRNTADRSTMATYVGERLRVGFEKAGYRTRYSASPKGSTAIERATALAGTDQDLFFVVTLREWSYDMGFAHPEFTHDITVDTFDGSGRPLGSEVFQGVDAMPMGGWKHYKKRYAELYQSVFDRVFASPALLANLAGDSTLPAPAPAAGANAETRLTELRTLRDKGLIDAEQFDAQQARILSEL